MVTPSPLPEGIGPAHHPVEGCPKAKCWSETGNCVNHGACNANDGCMYGPKKPKAPVKWKARTRKPAAEVKLTTLPPAEHLDFAERYLELAARHIDTAGDLAGTDQADMLACYASNVLQGSLALIRELRRSLHGRPGSKERRVRGSLRATSVCSPFTTGF